MIYPERPTELSVITTELVIDIPVLSNDKKWVSLRLSNCMSEFGYKLFTYIDTSCVWLSFFHILFLIVLVGKIVFFILLVLKYSSHFSTGNKFVAIALIVSYFIWLAYFIYVYIMKLKIGRWETVLIRIDIAIFAYQCFVTFLLAILFFREYAETWECTLIIASFLLCGFFAEKFPLALTLIIWFIYLCFFVEGLAKLVRCRWSRPCEQNHEVRWKAKHIPIVPFENSKHGQNKCAICLTDYGEGERICQLSCHPTHIFHPECVKEFLHRNHCCPYCRAPIS